MIFRKSIGKTLTFEQKKNRKKSDNFRSISDLRAQLAPKLAQFALETQYRKNHLQLLHRRATAAQHLTTHEELFGVVLLRCASHALMSELLGLEVGNKK